MGIFDKFTSKFAQVGKEKNVRHAVKPKAKKTASEKKKSGDSGLTPEEIKQAQQIEKGGATPEVVAKAKEKKVLQPRDTKEAHRILFRPLVTEKSSYLQSQNTYAFEVHPDATKAEIRKAFRSAYEIDPVGIAIMNKRGKEITYGRTRGETKSRKKTLIALPAGKTIDVFQS